MRLHILNRTGHTETVGTVEEIVGEVEKFMNTPGNATRYTILAEPPTGEAVRVSDPAKLREVDPESQVTLLPQLVGG